MAQPEIVRRIKTYSADNGRVYQYQFQGIEQRDQDTIAEYIYYATEDRTTMHAVRVIVMRDALKRWSHANARALTSTEEYALAKMRLLEGFDQDEGDLLKGRRELIVDDANVHTLLEKLNL